jgi:cytochrome c-type biogenesis protein CcmH
MLQCHYSLPAREKIDQMQKAGASDQAIVDSFVKESGLSALASPPAEGFNLLGWIMPFLALAFGLGVVAIWFKRFLRTRSATSPELPEIDRKYQERMDKELEELE